MDRTNLSGFRFGRLTVLKKVEPTEKGISQGRWWLCRCDCGRETVVSGSCLLRGHTKSCGCLKQKDLTGKHIGHLTVLGRSDTYATRGSRRVRLWECRCDCGAITYKATDTLTAGRESSCASCAQKHGAACARKKAGFVEGTQISKIREMKRSVSNTSGCRGVSYDSGKKLWEARIKFKGKSNRLGYFKVFEDAVKARKKAEERLFGEFLSQYEGMADNETEA